MRFILTCHTGFEPFTAQEAQELGARTLEVREGRVMVEGDERLLYRLNLWSRTCHRVLLLLGSFRIGGLQEAYEAAASLDYSFIAPHQSFAIRPQRRGRHEFTSLDLAAQVGQAVIDSYRASRGVRLKVDLEEPDIAIAADLIGDQLFLSIDTTGESLHKRGWRRYAHPSSIKPSLASALLIMAGWRGAPLLDPFTGGATIPIEAMLRWLNRPTILPGAERLPYYRKLSIHDEALEREELRSPPPPLEGRPERGSILGLEVSPRHLKGGWENIKGAGLEGLLELELADCTKWAKGRFPFIVTNPPYGIRSGRREYVLRLYSKFAQHLNQILELGGVLVIVSTEREHLKGALQGAGLSIVEERKGIHGNLGIWALKAVR